MAEIAVEIIKKETVGIIKENVMKVLVIIASLPWRWLGRFFAATVLAGFILN